LVFLARGLLGLAVLAAGAVAAGVMQRPGALFTPWSAELHFAAFYAAAFIAFAALPGSRRNDIALALIVLGALAEIARGVVGRDLNIGWILAEAAGVLAVQAPTYLEALRAAMRDNPSSKPFHGRRADPRAALLAWTLVIGVVFATLGPQSLRPHLGDPQIERFCAFFITAGACVIAYPRRPMLIALGAVALAVLLECGQIVVPGRDAGLDDALAKALGGASGAILTALIVGAGRQVPRRAAPIVARTVTARARG
jgi:hypothetical protein